MSAALSREVLEARIVRERQALAEALGDLRERARAEAIFSAPRAERPVAVAGPGARISRGCASLIAHE